MREADLLIIGGGAAGLMAAGTIGGRGRVLLADGNRKLGKKLLATGNGRCNLTNLEIGPEKYHGDPLAKEVLAQVPAGRVLGAFERMGLLCRADSEGRAYPRSLQALSVLRALEGALGDKAERLTETEITELRRQGKGFLAATRDGGAIAAGKVLLACGGKASPAHSTGSGYELAKCLGHHVTELSPSLAPLRVEGKVCRALKGMRCRAKATLYRRGRALYAENGEVIFGDGQLSGICIFDLSARLREMGPDQVEVGLDLAAELEEQKLFTYLKTLCAARPELPASELFSGMLNLRVGQELVRAAGVRAETPLSRLKEAELSRCAKLCKDWRFTVTGSAGWKDAQVTAGGVPLSEVNLQTMESKLCPGLYLAGELLDVDGDCGGYNLHWAWSTGLLAGLALKEELPC